MTRTARRGPENKKKYEASEWRTLKPAAQLPPSRPDSKKTAVDGTGKKHSEGLKRARGQFVRKRKKGDILKTLLAKEQRREQRRQKRRTEREMKKLCFRCRLPGHRVEECMMGDSSGQGTGICYRCGSTEHMSSACKAKGSKDHMPYASCYVCGNQGHLARSCPDNPRGLYPLGGGCKTCGSVEHFQRDCAEYLAKQGISSKTLKKISIGASADAEDDEYDTAVVMTSEQQPQQKATKKKKPKVIKF